MEFVTPFERSALPLTMSELVGLIDGTEISGDIYSGGLVKANWECGYAEDNDTDAAIDFVSLSSPFYPKLAVYYQSVAEEWALEYNDEDNEA